MRLLLSSILLFTLLAAMPSQAAISYSGVQDIEIPVSFAGVYVDFTNMSDATQYTTSTSGSGTWDFNFFFGGAAIGTSDTLTPVTVAASTNSPIVNQTDHVSVVDNSSLTPTSFSGSTGHMTPSGTFTNDTEGYIGFVLQDAGGVGTDYYGWARVTLSDDGTTGTLHDWAWDINGNSIVVGVIPEPSLPALTAFVLLSCAIARRNRRTSTSAAV